MQMGRLGSWIFIPWGTSAQCGAYRLANGRCDPSHNYWVQYAQAIH